MKYDVIIVGMGIAGITSAIYASRSGMNCLLIEKNAPGGVLNQISHIDNYPGINQAKGPDIAYALFQQVNDLKVPYKIETVENIKKDNGLFVVKTNTNEYQSEYVIVATGREALSLGLEYEANILGRGISYCALCDGFLYKDKEVAVVGANEHAMEELEELVRVVSKIHLIVKGSKLRGHDILKNEKVEIHYESEITDLKIENNRLEGIILNGETEIKLACVFLYLGYKPNVKFMEDSSVLNKASSFLVNDSCETKIEGLYAIGDAIVKSTYQLVTAANDAITVVQEINRKKLRKGQ